MARSPCSAAQRPAGTQPKGITRFLATPPARKYRHRPASTPQQHRGRLNTATGYQALSTNTTGGANTAIGDSALFGNTSGHDNTANGAFALFSGATGSSNTAIGSTALFNNSSTEGFNTATGADALFNNTTGAFNTANGYQALFTNGTGIGNTAIGDQALFTILPVSSTPLWAFRPEQALPRRITLSVSAPMAKTYPTAVLLVTFEG